jgi:hypothetical protein
MPEGSGVKGDYTIEAGKKDIFEQQSTDAARRQQSIKDGKGSGGVVSL